MPNNETWRKALREEFYGKKPSSRKYLAIFAIFVVAALALSFLAQEFKVDFATNEERRTQASDVEINTEEDAIGTVKKTSSDLQSSLGLIDDIKSSIK